MNASDVLKYGHQWFLKAIDGMPASPDGGQGEPEDKWDKPGATGTWSPKDILSHITSYEQVLIPLLEEFIQKNKSENNPIPDHKQFNIGEVEKRKDKNYQEILDEYNNYSEKVLELIIKIPAFKLAENGTLPWYGEEYCLDDYLVYTYYGHKREHGAQIAEFKNQIAH